MKKIIFSLIFFLLLATMARAEEYYSTNDIVDSIWIIEGGVKTNYPFGIKSVYCSGYDECRQVCVNTVENTKIRYNTYGYKQEKEFLTFLAKRYAPYEWEAWLSNLKFYLRKK